MRQFLAVTSSSSSVMKTRPPLQQQRAGKTEDTQKMFHPVFLDDRVCTGAGEMSGGGGGGGWGGGPLAWGPPPILFLFWDGKAPG